MIYHICDICQNMRRKDEFLVQASEIWVCKFCCGRHPELKNLKKLNTEGNKNEM